MRHSIRKPRISSKRQQDLINLIKKAKAQKNIYVLSEIFKSCNLSAAYDHKARQVMTMATAALTEIKEEKQ